MRALTALALLVVFAGCPEDLPPQPPPKPPPPTVATLSELAGKVTLTREGASNAATNGPLYEGDVLATGGGGHALLRGGGREVELLENSRFTVGKSLAELSLDVGELVFLESDAGAYQTSLGSVKPGAGARVKLQAGAGDAGDTFEVGVGELELLDVEATDGGATLKAGQRFVVGVGVLELDEVKKPPEVVKPSVKLTPKGTVTLKPKSGALVKLPNEGRDLQEQGVFTVDKAGQLTAEAKGSRGTFAGGSKGTIEPVDGEEGFKATLKEGQVRIFLKEGESVLLDGKKPLKLKAKSASVAVVTATKTGPKLDVIGGDVGAKLGDDEVDVPAGESAQVKGTTMTVLKRGAPVLTLPAGRNARVNWARPGDVLLQFADGEGDAEVATDAEFENVLLSSKAKELQVTAPMRGFLYWRRAGGEVTQARFERDDSAGAVSAKSDTVAETGLKATVYFQGGVPTLTFTFPPRDDAANWRFRVYAANDLKNALVDKRVNENKAVVESGVLAEGSYLWSAVATLNSGAEASGGRMNKMDIVFDNSVTRLVLTSPKEGQHGGNAVGIAPLGAKLALNGKPVTLDDSGRFSTPLPAASVAVFRLTSRDGSDSYWVRRLTK